MPAKIAVICLDAKGAVLRSWALLPGITKKFPQSELTWITNIGNKALFKRNPYKITVLDPTQKIPSEFDILYNLDIEKPATQLASTLTSKAKFGFYEEGGYPSAFNAGAEYYLNTLFDDELKKSNRKTYQEMIFDIAELPYHKEHCPLLLGKDELEYAQKFKESNNLGKKKVIGIHMGASSRWPSKVWSSSKVKDFIVQCSKMGHDVILFGGPNEVHAHKELSNQLKRAGISFARNDPHNSDLEFASLVNICDTMVCSDSFALHVSLALLKKTVCLFFCTSPDEIEGYGRLTKIVSPKLYDFFPEKMNEYNEDLVNSISVKEVLDAL